jgi:hypothetical protein
MTAWFQKIRKENAYLAWYLKKKNEDYKDSSSLVTADTEMNQLSWSIFNLSRLIDLRELKASRCVRFLRDGCNPDRACFREW